MNFDNKVKRAAVPFEVTQPDRIPTERYYDPHFFEMEKEHLWPHVWQMACRLEEIPLPGDYTVYRILDKSVIVVRTGDNSVKAYHNHCRHRGVELVQTQGKTSGGFICPFHGWRWDTDGNSTFVYGQEAFSEANMCKEELNLLPVRLDLWGGCAWINFDKDAPPLRDSLEPFATAMDAWKVEDLKVEWWLAAHLPCNWKLAMEGFMEGYHVATTHPQLLVPGVQPRPGEHFWTKLPKENATVAYWTTMGAQQMPSEVSAREFIDLNIHFMKLLNEGMAGMTHEQEVALAERLIDLDLPKNPVAASVAWRRAINQAVMDHYDALGTPVGDLHEVDRQGYGIGVNFCFPHYFLLPTFGSASSYRIRPLGPEECLFELWSLTRYAPGEKRERPKPPVPMKPDDQRWPPIPKQDFANLPRQQRGLHNGMEYMRLSHEMEGLISNYQRVIDGFLRGADKSKLVAAMQKASGPIDVPVAQLDL